MRSMPDPIRMSSPARNQIRHDIMTARKQTYHEIIQRVRENGTKTPCKVSASDL